MVLLSMLRGPVPAASIPVMPPDSVAVVPTASIAPSVVLRITIVSAPLRKAPTAEPPVVVVAV